MFLFGDIFTELISAMRAETKPAEQEKALRRVNMKLREIAKLASWAEMRQKIALSYLGDAMQLPSNLLGIDLVWDDDSEIEYHDRNRHSSEAPETAFRYYTYPIGSNLAQVDDVAINQDGTTFVSDDLLALGLDTDDEWFYVDGVEQYYQITSNTDNLYTFAPAYRGSGSLNAARITVRPKTTLMLQLVGPYGTDISSATIDLHYWAMPDMLRDPSDIVPLPSSDCLTLSTLASLPEARKDRPVSDTKVQQAIDKAISMNPDRPKARVPMGINGKQIDYSGNPYGRRGATTNQTLNTMVRKWRSDGITA